MRPSVRWWLTWYLARVVGFAAGVAHAALATTLPLGARRGLELVWSSRVGYGYAAIAWLGNYCWISWHKSLKHVRLFGFRCTKPYDGYESAMVFVLLLITLVFDTLLLSALLYSTDIFWKCDIDMQQLRQGYTFIGGQIVPGTISAIRDRSHLLSKVYIPLSVLAFYTVIIDFELFNRILRSRMKMASIIRDIKALTIESVEREKRGDLV